MILAVDIGNSNILVGCVGEGETVCVENLSSDMGLAPVEYAIRIKSIMDIYGINLSDIKGCAVSSVVPQLTTVISEAVCKLLGEKPLIVGPGLKTGLNIRIDNPAQLGSSLLAYSVAALEEHEPPLIVVEMSTATTFCTVNRQRQYVGGVICAGVRTALDSLVSNAALLHQVGIEAPQNVIGRNTADSLKSGIVYGTAACIDGIIDRIEAQMNESCTVIATGRFASLVTPHCKRKIIVDDRLILKGLKVIYEKNRG